MKNIFQIIVFILLSEFAFGQTNLVSNLSFETGQGNYFSFPSVNSRKSAFDTTGISRFNIKLLLNYHYSISRIGNSFNPNLIFCFKKHSIGIGLFFTENIFPVYGKVAYAFDYSYKFYSKNKFSLLIGAEVSMLNFEWYSFDCRTCTPSNYELYKESYNLLDLELSMEYKIINHLSAYVNVGTGLNAGKISIVESSGMGNKKNETVNKFDFLCNVGLLISIFK